MVAPEPLAVSSTEFELLVKNDIFAEAVPEAVGVNVTVYGTL
jgi:hypothetical protein